MHYMRIRNHIINLEDVCNIEPNLSDIVIYFKNGTSTSIHFSDCDKRNDMIDEIWHRLVAMR